MAMLRRNDDARNRWRFAPLSGMSLEREVALFRPLARRLSRSPLTLSLLTLPALTGLAACGRSAPVDPPANDVAPGNDAIAATIARLSPKQRDAVLFRAVRDAGHACQQVMASQPVAPMRGLPAWVATCDDGGLWLVVIGTDGIATVTRARPDKP